MEEEAPYALLLFERGGFELGGWLRRDRLGLDRSAIGVGDPGYVAVGFDVRVGDIPHKCLALRVKAFEQVHEGVAVIAFAAVEGEKSGPTTV